MTPSVRGLRRGAALRREQARRIRALVRDDATATLSALRRTCRVGIITDCAVETVDTWDELPFAAIVDATTFSCSEGQTKKRGELFAAILARLRLPPEACWYVADGRNRELDVAAALGMEAIQLVVPGETIPRQAWSGTVISRLSEVVKLAGEAAR